MLLSCLLIATATSPPKQGTAAPSHALRHDAPKQGPICHAVAFSSLFACCNLVFSSILRAILHTTDIDQRPALVYMGERIGTPSQTRPCSSTRRHPAPCPFGLTH